MHNLFVVRRLGRSLFHKIDAFLVRGPEFQSLRAHVLFLKNPGKIKLSAIPAPSLHNLHYINFFEK